jgi:hypothetical protein
VEGMIVYNLTENDSLQAGIYVNTNARWVHLSETPFFTQNWFYMPSVVFDASKNEVDQTKDLYQEFKKQMSGNSGVIGSVAAPALKTLPAATDLYYYVTAYDDKVFSNISISSSGVMKYDIIGQASDSTLINIVFVEK